MVWLAFPRARQDCQRQHGLRQAGHCHGYAPDADVLCRFAHHVLAGMRTNAANSDLSKILPEELEAQVKEAAKLSMGTEVRDQYATGFTGS
jgi:hypothetical protein